MLLAFDTSTPLCSVAISVGGQVYCLEDVLSDHSHTEKLFEYVDELLNKHGFLPRQLEGIVVGLGPGSYTGLRVAASAAKGMAYALDIPVYGVSSLQTIHRRFILGGTIGQNDLVITAIDARRMEVYASAFCWDGSALFENKAVKVSENTWSEYRYAFENVHIVGVGVSKLHKVFAQPNVRITDNVYPSAKDSLLIKEEKIATPLDLAYFEPLYVKQFGEL
ncbi:MAG: tRNA (adenosine(37)-N6)-threonylcarbamoyltransferase complex dimerization subunit type 1 TsaB [Thermaurantimonas sp.]